ncbi:MAG: diguanylate cyclase [Chloroflexota bacterium]|nr:diguanylate cyclase [Chloroflexota bacterium]
MAGESILIVDDEESIRTLLGKLCKEEGYNVLYARDTEGAFRVLEENPIDVGIVDLKLPGAGGIEVLRRAKELYPRAEIIILTGYADLKSAIDALRLGAYDYLEKPLVDLRILPLTIARALEKQRLHQDKERLVRDLREANHKLRLRRKQQLEHMRHIGEALAGIRDPLEMAEGLVQTLLNILPCDGVGLLLMPREEMRPLFAITGGKRTLSSKAQNELLTFALEETSSLQRARLEDIEIQQVAASSRGNNNDEPWRSWKVRPLSVQDDVLATVILAKHSDEGFDPETLRFFDVLASQGSIALQNAYLFMRMQELATQDSLTGLYDHGHFFQLLQAEKSRIDRHGQELAVIMMDIDSENGLKVINDTYGHQAGDNLLRAVADLLRDGVRCEDVVARYGGDEFIILAPHTGRVEALALAKRLCKKIREEPFEVAGDVIHISVSVGVAVSRSGGSETGDEIVTRADNALYLAKRQGGNQVRMLSTASEDEYPAAEEPRAGTVVRGDGSHV